MSSISDVTAYAYPDEVLVEVIGRDESGEVMAITYQFSYVDGSTVEGFADQTIDEAHVEPTREALADCGYQLPTTEA